MKILILALLLAGCGGGWPPWQKPKDPPVADPAISAEQVVQLQNISANTRLWAKVCTGGITCFDESDGDSALYAGIACLAGESSQCEAVKASMSPDGQLWRAPDRVQVDKSNSSSRDMLLGGLAYIVATKDVGFARKLISYIHSHDEHLCANANDNRCSLELPIYSEIWGTISKVYEYIGLTPDNTMRAGTFGESSILAFESKFSPTGYQTHLPLVEMLIRQRIGGWDGNLMAAANNVTVRQPTNPFYEYVAHGATQRAADLVIQECSGPEPEHKDYWTWQEDVSKQRWSNRNGWDCITVIDLLTRRQ